MGQMKLLDQVRQVIRRKNTSYRTEQAYASWIKRYIFHHQLQHPGELAEREVESFPTYLAVDLQVAPSTQNQALAALKFLYLEVLHLPLDEEILPVPAKRSRHLPVVLSRAEVRAIITGLSGVHRLVCQLPYGCGLRLTECLSLRERGQGPPHYAAGSCPPGLAPPASSR
jgi:integrase